MEQPIVSVIIPVYNCEKYLRHCLDSVRNQTLENIEIICVDDGSSDSSPEIIKEYTNADKRFIYIRQENAGAGAARNNGLRISKGKYLSFLDSDDFFEPDMLEKAVAKISEDKADFVVFRCNQFMNDTRTFRNADYTMRLNTLPPYTPFNFRAITGNVFKTFVGWAWDKVYDRDFVIKNGLTFQEQRTSNDMRFVFTALVLAKKITYITDILAHQRRNNGSSLSNTREKSWFCFYNALKELRDNLKNAGLYKELERDYINYALHFSLWNINTITGPCYEVLYNKLKDEWFEDLGVKGKSADYFYDKNEYKQYEEIMKYSFSEYVNKISVVIKVENDEKHLRRCLDSVLSNSDIKTEIICIDNCSTDSGVSVINEYKEKYPDMKVVLNSSPESDSKIMDKGLELAGGQYVHFINGCDEVENVYSKLYKLAEKNELDCLKASSDLIDDSTDEKINRDFYLLKETDKMLNETLIGFRGFPKKMFRIPYEPWNALYRRTFLNENKIRFSDYDISPELGFYFTVCMKSEKFMMTRIKLINHRESVKKINSEDLINNFRVTEILSRQLGLDAVTTRKVHEYQVSVLEISLENNDLNEEQKNTVRNFLDDNK